MKLFSQSANAMNFAVHRVWEVSAANITGKWVRTREVSRPFLLFARQKARSGLLIASKLNQQNLQAILFSYAPWANLPRKEIQQ